jgi:hypothetical protein
MEEQNISCKEPKKPSKHFPCCLHMDKTDRHICKDKAYLCVQPHAYDGIASIRQQPHSGPLHCSEAMATGTGDRTLEESSERGCVGLADHQ